MDTVQGSGGVGPISDEQLAIEAAKKAAQLKSMQLSAAGLSVILQEAHKALNTIKNAHTEMQVAQMQTPSAVEPASTLTAALDTSKVLVAGTSLPKTPSDVVAVLLPSVKKHVAAALAIAPPPSPPPPPVPNTLSLPISINTSQMSAQQIAQAYIAESLATITSQMTILNAASKDLTATPPPSALAQKTIENDMQSAYAQIQLAKNTISQYGSAAATPGINTLLTDLQSFLSLPSPYSSTPITWQAYASNFLQDADTTTGPIQTLMSAGQAVANEIGASQNMSLWGDVSQWILGSMMSKLQAKLSSAQALLAKETQMFNRLGSMLAELNKWTVGGVAVPIHLDIPTGSPAAKSAEWAKFRIELQNLKAFKSHGLSSWEKVMEKKIADMEIQAKGNPSLQQKVDSLWGKLKNVENFVGQVVNLNSQQIYKGASLRILKMPLSQIGMTHIQLTTDDGGKVTLTEPKFATVLTKVSPRAIANKFANYLSQFSNAIKNNHATIEGYSNAAQANLRMQITYMQEMYQIAPQLLQTLSDMAKAVAQNEKGQ